MSTPATDPKKSFEWSSLSRSDKVGAVVFSVLIVALLVGGTWKGIEWATSDAKEVPVETPKGPAQFPSITPVIVEGTITPTDAEKMIYVCQTVANATLKLNQEGLSERETMLFLANELNITLSEMGSLLDLCINYYGDLKLE